MKWKYFSGDSVIKVSCEVIEVTLDDQGEAKYEKCSKTQGIVMLKF